MISFWSLRPYEKDGVIKVADKYLGVTAHNHVDALQRAEEVLEILPIHDRYNIFCSAAHTEPASREFISQDILPFDVDGIDYSKKELYIDILCEALGVLKNECASIYSGHGIHFLVGLKNPLTKKDEFRIYRPAYKELCDKINAKITERGLPGGCDTDMFSAGRLIRLPYSINRKPIKNPLKGGNAPVKVTMELEQLLYKYDFIKQENVIEKPVVKKKIISTKVDKNAIVSGCEYLKYAKENSATLKEPEWYAALGIAAFFDDNGEFCHELSKDHPNYSREETELKIEQARKSDGPRTCADICSRWNGCVQCDYYQEIKTPLQIKSNKDVVRASTNEISIVSTVLEDFKITINPDLSTNDDGDILQSDGDFFIYTGTHWQEQGEEFKNELKRKIMLAAGGNLTFNKVEAIYKQINVFIPHPGIKNALRKTNPFAANFLDGTLHFNQDKKTLEFHPHRKTDYITNVIPWEYSKALDSKNEVFEDTLQKIFKDDADKDEKIKAIQEEYGMAIMPVWPHFWLHHGVAGSGKSTLFKILANLLAEENICSVQPHEFKGFHLESMVGRLNNIVTDLSSRETIDDAAIKQIEDRTAIRIQRKFRKDLYAPMPPVHHFACNDLPRNFDGSKRAHSRRWTFIQYNYSITANGKYNKDYAYEVFKHNPLGILGFALRGLKSVIDKNGDFTNPESGKNNLDSWQKENNTIELFVDDIKDNEVMGLSLVEEERAKRSRVWVEFQQWKRDAGREHSRIGKHKFFKLMEEQGFKLKRTEGIFYFNGISEVNNKEAF